LSYDQNHILFISTSYAEYDRRMQRIVKSLIKAGYKVSWIARTKDHPIQIDKLNFMPIQPSAKSGFMFYAQFNIKAQKLALKSDAAIISAVDLDTIMAASWAMRKGRRLVFDAHEHFTEVPELKGRNLVKNYWGRLARKYIPKMHKAYTVNQSLSELFEQLYRNKFDVIRNVPIASPSTADKNSNTQKIISYVGVLNMGRGLHQILEAMVDISEEYHLQLIGDGDIRRHLETRTEDLGLEHRVKFLGYVHPDKINALLENSWCGINLLDSTSLNYYYSLANKYFDYIHAACPQICMSFPEYRLLNKNYETAVLVDNLEPKSIHQGIEKLTWPNVYNKLKEQCVLAREEYVWDNEEPKLLEIYKQLF